MAQGSLYKKFGNNGGPGMSLVKSQQATGQAFKDVLNSISGMVDDAEKGYVEENTLNMQEYLKKNIKDAGLGADTTDQTAIKQKFGSLINMDQITATISGTKKEMETEAMNTAGQVASQVLSKTGDPIKARRAYTQHLTDLGGSAQFKSAATKSWSDMQEGIFTDIQAEKVQRQNATLSGIQAGLVENGAADANARIELALQNEDPKDHDALRQSWRASIESMAGVTKEQASRNLSYLAQQDGINAIKSQELSEVTSSLTSQSTALQKNYIPEATDAQLSTNTKGFGQSMLTAVDAELGWFNSGDVANIKAMRDQLITDGIPDPEAERIMTHVFDLVYDGGSWHGNNLSSGDITQAQVETDRLSQIYKNKAALDGQVTTARNAESRFNLKSQLDRAELQLNLTEASRNRNVMNNPEGSSGVWQRRLAELSGGEPQVQATPKQGTPAPVVDPNVQQEGESRIAFLIRMGGNTDPSVVDPPTAVDAPSQPDTATPTDLSAFKRNLTREISTTGGSSEKVFHAPERTEAPIPGAARNREEFMTNLNLGRNTSKEAVADTAPNDFNEFISPDSSVIDEAPLTIFAKAIKKADAPKKVTQLFKGSFANISATDEIINGTHGRNVPKSEQIGMAKMVRDNVPKEDWPQIIEQISGTNTLLAKLLAEALGLS